MHTPSDSFFCILKQVPRNLLQALVYHRTVWTCIDIGENIICHCLYIIEVKLFRFGV